MAIFLPDQIKILTRASNDFVYFINTIFPLSFRGSFIGGPYVDEIARFLSRNQKTIRISPKGHMKSTSLYAYFMWKLLFEGASNNLECHYFSFQEQMAGYHISKIKNLIRANPYYEDLIDKKPIADSTLKYTWDNKHYTTLEPHGLIAFNRGIHGDIIFVDDPFQDPSSELVLTTIMRINEVFKSVILDMPKEKTGELNVVGTPQTREDFFFNKNITKRFKVKILPAIREGKALWPEYMDMNELLAKKSERGERVFKREYLCDPVYSTKAYFTEDYLRNKVINSNLVNLGIMTNHDIEDDVIAGFDIGQKTHPSHFCFDSKTEILTKDGWKKFKEVLDEDEIATLNEKKDLLEYQKPLKIFSYNYKGKMYKIKNKGVDLLVTPNHKMFFSSGQPWRRHKKGEEKIKLGKKKWKWAKRWNENYKKENFELIEAKKIFGKYGQYKRDVENWKGIERKSFKIPSVTTYRKLRRPKDIISKEKLKELYLIKKMRIKEIAKLLKTNESKICSELHRYKIHELKSSYKRKNPNYKMKYFWSSLKIPMDLWLEFLGYWISEGGIANTQIHVAQQFPRFNKRNINTRPKMKKCLEKLTKILKVKLGISKLGHFRFNSVQVSSYIKKLGRSKYHSHFIPKEFKELSKRQLRILFDALMLGDGSKTDNHFFSSASPKLLDDMQELALKVGYVGTKNLKYKRLWLRTNEKTQRTMRPIINSEKQQDAWVDYEGEVYCVEVPNHIVYVRRNGKGVWSGNSVFRVIDGKWRMIHQKFMDKWPYSNGSNYFPGKPTQLEYLKRAIESLKITKLYFDNTRGEFIGFMEQGLVPHQMVPVTITHKLKVQTGTTFGTMVDNQEMEIIDDDRLIKQICSVTNEFKTLPSPRSHGDAFCSISLATLGRTIIFSGKNKSEISVGGRSLFLPDGTGKIPKNW